MKIHLQTMLYSKETLCKVSIVKNFLGSLKLLQSSVSVHEMFCVTAVFTPPIWIDVVRKSSPSTQTRISHLQNWISNNQTCEKIVKTFISMISVVKNVYPIPFLQYLFVCNNCVTDFNKKSDCVHH